MQHHAGLLVPTALAGLTAVLATVAVERWGGRRGGVLASIPSSIVPASWGLLADAPDTAAEALGMVPVGMLINAGFLWTWRVLPPLLHARAAWRVVLGLQVTLSLAAWGALAVLALTGAAALEARGWTPMALGVAALGMHAAIAVAACWRPAPAPAGRRRVGPLALASRAVLAAAAIAASLLLARHGDGLLAGLAAVFPAIFLTTMVAVWIAQGEAVQAGAVGPMMLGATSVSAYALLCASLAPHLGVGAAVALSWCGVVTLVSAPAAAWLDARAAATARP